MEPRPRPLPALLDELVEEVLLRCPPDDPARLLRAALVCKRWCRLICGAGFRRRFWELHRTPPMLGFFYNVGSFSKFIPTFTPCPPLADARHRRVIDARHGRVLYHSADWQPWQNPLENAFVLWDPITGERRELPLLPVALNPYSWNAAVLCAGSASGDCDHIDCHSRPFLVVLVITVRMVMFACVYSSEAGVWSEPTTAQHPYSEVELRPRGAVVGNTLYFALRYNKGTSSRRRDVSASAASRRGFLLVPSLAAAAAILRPLPSSAAAANDADAQAPTPLPTDGSPSSSAQPTAEAEAEPEPDESAMSRVYDATVLGEPQAMAGTEARRRVWEKLAAARVVYLGEAELQPDPDDRVLELEIVRGLAGRCADAGRGLALALEAFPCDLQQQLDQFIDGRIDGSILKLYTLHWPPERWQEYEPLLNYCRDTGIKLIACGAPLEVKRTVQAEGIRGLSKAEREAYAPPAGSGFISGFMSNSDRSLIDKISSTDDSPFSPTSYLSLQARVVDDYTMSQIIMKELNGDPSRMLIVVTGANHVIYGTRGIGVPARLSKKLSKKDQVVVLLDPEGQGTRREGEIPVADFLWYSASKPCSRNCFDRAEIARVMNAARRRPEALPQDLQKGIDLGVVSPEILQNFFDLEKYPVMAELIHRFQGFRERLLADPKFLQRLAIEEAISITTTLLAQYERRKGRFFDEIDYVLTDTIRGSVVDFFTVWLPAPTISVLQYADDGSGQSLEFVKGLLGSLPDNAFQKNILGQDWNMNQRVAAVLVGGLKLASVGFISSVGAGFSSDLVYAARGILKPSVNVDAGRKRSPIWKSAAVYSCFLGTSANLRYQIIAGLVEYRLGESLVTYYNQPLLASLLSFVARTVNSYWGTQQWVDLARYTGLQKGEEKLPSAEATTPPELAVLEGGRTEVQNSDHSRNNNNNQSSGPT